MAKFNVFDENTWDIEIQDMEKLLRNKALGQIGQLISEIRHLRDVIEASQVEASQGSLELKLALALQKNHPVAYKLMGVTVTYPDLEVAEVIRLIDQVMDFWADKETREANWRHAVKLIKPLKPYLDKGHSYYAIDYRKKAIDELVTIKVTGNEAWDLYFQAEKNASYWIERYDKAKPTVYAPESYDSTDDLNASDDD